MRKERGRDKVGPNWQLCQDVEVIGNGVDESHSKKGEKRGNKGKWKGGKAHGKKDSTPDWGWGQR